MCPNQGNISVGQGILLMASLVLPTAIMVMPSITIQYARQDAWVSVLLATVFALLNSLVAVAFIQLFGGMSLFQATGQLLGFLPSKLLGALYLWWLLHTNALIIDEFAAFLCIAIMPDTPFLAFFILAIAVSAYAVWHGLEVLSRFNQLFLPFVLAILVGVFVLLAKEMRLQRILPLLDSSPFDVLRGAAGPLSWMGEIPCLLLLTPHMVKPKQIRLVALGSVLTVCAFMFLVVLLNLLVLGAGPSSLFIFSTYNAIRVVSIANFLERTESVVISMWMLSGFVKIGLFYYAAALGSAHLLGLKDYRPLVAPIGLVLLGLAMLCRNIVDLMDFIKRVWPPYALVFEAVVPLLLLTVALLKGRGGNKVAKEAGPAGTAPSCE
ncbi:MAG: GerAB/ArcD/ProY family transporter [Bacillota bacterium]